ncbi:hypothetical protein [Niveispirillum irakense]|uniref:hypothetical protein n=1 Tax=Niveispirillum irakense TaxID=34011 RepID=UPI00041F1B39|nr:hypothetical protein [Niveispirillum irakense]
MSLSNASSEPVSLLGTMLRRIGNTLDDVEGRSFGPQTHQGPMVISGDPMEDTLGSRRVIVKSVRHLKELAGIPDEHVRAMSAAGDTIRYPAAAPIDANAAIDRARDSGQPLGDPIHPTDRDMIDLALHAYVMGDSDRVRLHEPLIDALRFPAELVVATAQDITVTAENPLIIGPNSPYAKKDPTLGALAAFGTVTVKSEGVIEISIPITITADRFIFEGPKPGVIKVVGIDGTPGQDGGPGQDGAKGADATGGQSLNFMGIHECFLHPTDSVHGSDGGSGQPGTSGGNGDCRASRVTVVAGELSGRILVQLVGGNGGMGGKGGMGGIGGMGGAGAVVDPYCSVITNPETGTAFGTTLWAGAPGRGGGGGPGGNGGNAATLGPQITVLYTSLAPDSEWTFDAGRFGSRGTGGRGGMGGTSGEIYHIHYQPWVDNYPGQQGSDGRAGTDMSYAPILVVRPAPSSL